MHPFLNEHDADQETIRSLLATIQVLMQRLEQSQSVIELQQERLIKQGKDMQKKILQDINGGLYVVREFEELAADEAMKLYEHFKEQIAMLEKYLHIGETKPAESPATTEPSTPAADNPQPTDNGQAPVDQSQSTPSADQTTQSAPAAPVDQPAQTAQVDANGNPVQTAPAADPNQAQTQTEQPVLQPLQ